MNHFTEFYLFLAASMALIIAPGPGIFVVLAKATQLGSTEGLKAAFGCFLGIFSHVFLVLVGVASLLKLNPILFTIVQYLGAGYLIYAGLKCFKQQVTPKKEGHQPAPKPQTHQRGSVIEAFFINSLNPKLTVFFMSYFPQFVNNQTGDPLSQTFILGSVFALLTWVYFSMVALVGAYLKKSMAESTLGQDIIRRVSGTVLVGLGIKLVADS